MTIVPRAGWRARPPRKVYRLPRRVKQVWVHHGVVSPKDPARQLRSMQASHMDGRGYNDLAYNFGVDAAGTAYEIRGWRAVGAHTKGWNDRSIGIVYIGNAETTKPTAAAVATIAELVREGIRVGALDKAVKIGGHRDVGKTACPGKHLYARLDDIRTAVAAKRRLWRIAWRIRGKRHAMTRPDLDAAFAEARARLLEGLVVTIDRKDV